MADFFRKRKGILIVLRRKQLGQQEWAVLGSHEETLGAMHLTRPLLRVNILTCPSLFLFQTLLFYRSVLNYFNIKLYK